MQFYDKVLYLLKKRNITQNEMIRQLKLGKNAMFHWKNDKNIPSGETLLKLSHYFNVPVDFLLDNVDSYLSEEFVKNLEQRTLCQMLDLLSNEFMKRRDLQKSFPSGELKGGT